jgi:hypothetical protein
MRQAGAVIQINIVRIENAVVQIPAARRIANGGERRVGDIPRHD